MERSRLDHLRLVVSNGRVPMKPRAQSAPQQMKLQPPAPKTRARPAGSFNVWIGPDVKKRIEKSLAQIKQRIGFVPPSNTHAVLYLLDSALKRLEMERAEDVPPIPARDAF